MNEKKELLIGYNYFMLLSKKIFHLLNFLKNQKTIIFFLRYFLFYNFKVSSIYFLIYLIFLKYFLKKKNNPLFFLFFKINVLNKFFFNSILIKIFAIFKELNVFLNINFKFLKKNRKNYTILRSPFVYKKSREQFFFDRFKGWFYLSLFSKNFFFIDYLENVLVKILVFPFLFKIIIKKIMYLNKNET